MAPFVRADGDGQVGPNDLIKGSTPFANAFLQHQVLQQSIRLVPLSVEIRQDTLHPSKENEPSRVDGTAR